MTTRALVAFANTDTLMLSPGDRATITAEIERLQKVQSECPDGGIRTRIDVWIVEHKRKLALDHSPCPICGKPCPPEQCVTDEQDRTLHKKCFRPSKIQRTIRTLPLTGGVSEQTALVPIDL
jgi:hypothetical protein